VTDDILKGRRILVVEDEYLLADDLSRMLADAGAEVLGPVPSVREALVLIDAAPPIDGAVLDVNLRGEMVFPVAHSLQDRGIPFAFATGYDAWALPEQFSTSPRMDKPLKMDALIALLEPLLKRSNPAAAH